MKSVAKECAIEIEDVRVAASLRQIRRGAVIYIQASDAKGWGRGASILI